MAAVGEPFLSSVFRGALQKLDSPILRKFKSLAGIDKDLRKLNRTLSKIQFVLNDAEAKQISNWAVKDLIDELKDLAFDVDDVLDEVATEAFRLIRRKDEIAKEGDELGLKGVQVASTELRDSKRLSSSLIDESEVFEEFVPPRGRKRLEDIASDYFEDLLLRSFFQKSKTILSKFVMHDLIHDLAQSVAGEMCFRLEHEKLQNIPEMVRHSSVLVDAFKSVTFEALYTKKKKKSLRTMLVPCNKISPHENSNVTVPHDFVRFLRCLRSLDMSHISIKELSNSVGDLMHMSKLLILPEGTQDLVNLRHLDLTGCWHLKSMPPSLGRLASLQRLHRFVAGNETGSGINEFKDMNELQATLCIDRVEDVLNVEDAKRLA
ncbi:hypothetical protein GH714_017280 [Hevea brasiliensis]|uniref:Uncharacterized protein n=1 Tax=Hevea brasiliensis TaxID=3981 RepID=A0A6A6NB18_HEVBR|nr:hypothetical protein GH714_017280 [Hevea brasiliensis]